MNDKKYNQSIMWVIKNDPLIKQIITPSIESKELTSIEQLEECFEMEMGNKFEEKIQKICSVPTVKLIGSLFKMSPKDVAKDIAIINVQLTVEKLIVKYKNANE